MHPANYRKYLTTLSAWELPRVTTTFAPPGTFTNIDTDVTPMDQRIWTVWTMLGYWFSDLLNTQTYSAPSAIIQGGLSPQLAVLCAVMGIVIISIPMVLNGEIGATLHVSFPISARSSFGYHFAKAPIIIRAATALFWHSIQTYTGGQAMTQVIRSIWPSYLDMPNTLPASAGITSQQLLSHFLYWLVQFPFLMIHPHKLKRFFIFKAVSVTVIVTAICIWLCVRAGGPGDLWNTPSTVQGSQQSWLILSGMMSMCAGWATLSVNVGDFTRYLKRPAATWIQLGALPFVSTYLGVIGLICSSAGQVIYGEIYYDPLDLIGQFEGPSGRALAFFGGAAWVIAQIGVNASANVFSCANDLSSLFPKYLNIRRSAVLITITGAWIMVPWKIVTSAASLLNFMGSLGVFLAPIAAILASDYWLVKRRHVDIPGLYRPHGRYSYGSTAGFNWRALIAMLVSLGPNMPGLCAAVNPSLNIGGAQYIADISYIYGFTSAFVTYAALSWAFPAKGTLIATTIWDDSAESIEGVSADGQLTPLAEKTA